MNSQFLTIEEVASTLKTTRQTVSKLINNNKLNAVRINKSYRIYIKDFHNFLEKNSLISDTSIEYKKTTRDCHLDYENKSSEYDIFNSSFNGYLKKINDSEINTNNKFFFGDNIDVLRYLTLSCKSKVDLIYIDPPFGTGQDFSNISQELAYSDRLVNSEFLEFLRKRLFYMRELLSDCGSIYLHIDKKIGHYVKIIMDEVFGYKNFINDITRIKCNPKNFSRNAYGNYSDMILFYAKNKDKNIWNEIKEPLTKEEEIKIFPKVNDTYGRYTTNPIHAPGVTVDGDTGKEWLGINPPKGRHWRYSREELSKLNKMGLIEWSNNGNPRKIIFAKDHKGKKIQDVWTFKDKGLSYVNYPTQKNHELLERIIKNSSNPDSIVLDAFAGSGSTLVAANSLKRNWIGIDNSPQSFNTIKRILDEKDIECNYFEFINLD